MTAIAVLVVIFLIWKTFIVISMRETVIKERLGKFNATLGPGFHFFIPFIDRVAYKHEMREQVIQIPSQSCITRDNVQVEVDAVVYLKVMDAYKASYGIGDYLLAAISLAQTTVRSEIGKLNLDNTFSERDKINENIVQGIDKASDPWGIKFLRYEIRNITPSVNMVDTMEKQMEAERSKRAEITKAMGNKEFQITISEGKRQESINQSEGDRQQAINLAEGRARQIELVSEATANGLKRLAQAINKPGGSAALKMRIVEQFIQELGGILKKSKVSVVPMEIASLKSFFQGINTVGETMGDSDSTGSETKGKKG